MIDDQRRILNLLAEGKLNPAEAEALLDAFAQDQRGAPGRTAHGASPTAPPKYLRVLVEGDANGKPNKVNARVPLELIRAGMRLAALLPVVAYEPVHRALKENGVDVDISKIKPEDLEGLVAHLQELQVDVADGTERVRVFCE